MHSLKKIVQKLLIGIFNILHQIEEVVAVWVLLQTGDNVSLDHME